MLKVAGKVKVNSAFVLEPSRVKQVSRVPSFTLTSCSVSVFRSVSSTVESKVVESPNEYALAAY